MSNLRNKLDALKSDYRSQRYPGSLADDLLPPRRAYPVLRIGAFVGVAGALAAAVVLWIGQRPVIPPAAPPSQVAVTTQPQAEPDLPLASFPIQPAFPDDVPLTPSAADFEIPSMPEMPIISFDFSDLQDAKEST